MLNSIIVITLCLIGVFLNVSGVLHADKDERFERSTMGMLFLILAAVIATP